MRPIDRQGLFEVIDSFAIRNRNQFYLIGKIIEGEIEENWFVNIPFNSSLSMSVRINSIEVVEMASEKEPHTLLIVDCDDEVIDLLMSLNVGLEYLHVTIDGED